MQTRLVAAVRTLPNASAQKPSAIDGNWLVCYNLNILSKGELQMRVKKAGILAVAKAIVGAPTKTDSTKWALRKVANGDGTESLCVDYGVGLILFVR